MSIQIGQLVGRYQIVELLGQGGMAVVYRALDTRLERSVAIKFILRDGFAPNLVEQMLRRFEREALALARLSHANIVKIHDFGEYDSAPYLVMEYLSGGSLAAKMGAPLPYQSAAQILLPVAQALAFAHSQGILHRDIKPGNILFSDQGAPMLADFGIAKLLGDDQRTSLTGTGVGIGTPEYMSPEQGQGHALDSRSDVYSLGAVLYEMVTGRKPFTGTTPMAVVVKHITEPLPPPRSYVPGLPGEVEQILYKALAKQPAARYQSMEQLIDALNPLVMSHTPAAASPPASGDVLRALLDMAERLETGGNASGALAAYQQALSVCAPGDQHTRSVIQFALQRVGAAAARPTTTAPVVDSAPPPDLNDAPRPPGKLFWLAWVGVSLLGLVIGLSVSAIYFQFNVFAILPIIPMLVMSTTQTLFLRRCHLKNLEGWLTSSLVSALIAGLCPVLFMNATSGGRGGDLAFSRGIIIGYFVYGLCFSLLTWFLVLRGQARGGWAWVLANTLPYTFSLLVLLEGGAIDIVEASIMFLMIAALVSWIATGLTLPYCLRQPNRARP